MPQPTVAVQVARLLQLLVTEEVWLAPVIMCSVLRELEVISDKPSFFLAILKCLKSVTCAKTDGQYSPSEMVAGFKLGLS